MERIVDRLGGRREAQPSNHLEARRHKEAKSKLINASLSNLGFKTLLHDRYRVFVRDLLFGAVKKIDKFVTKLFYFSQSPNFCFDNLIKVLKEVMQAVTVKNTTKSFNVIICNYGLWPKRVEWT